MFDIAPTELLVLGAVAIIVIPPKDLPKAMRVAGYWVGKARSAARQFRSGFDNIVREAELQEMEKKWKAENERIMLEHPPTAEQAAMMELPAPGAVPEAGLDPALGDADDGGPPPATVPAPVIDPDPAAATLDVHAETDGKAP